VKKVVIILSAAIFLFVNLAHAQDSTLVNEPVYQNKILFLPALGSTPETGFMFGGVVVPQFKPLGAGPETRSSSLLFSGIYTTKKQLLFGLVTDIIFPEETWVMNGNYYINYFPNSYWGIGSGTRDEDELNMLFTEINLEQTVLKSVGKGLFTGPFIRWNKIYNLSFESREGNEINPPVVSGADGSTSAGVGWMSRWDLRDSNMTPTRNHYLQFSFLMNPSFLGSTDPYTSFLLDGRKYVDIKGDGSSVLAFQALFRSVAGSPPFLDMSELGGDRIGRGYYSGRYRDVNAGQIQSEWRQSIKGRFGFTVFGALGEVWSRYDEIHLESVKWSAGVGFRINTNKNDPTNIRIDYGVGRGGASGFYIQFGEAF
jgi:hypothetical protein